ncbi:MAG: (d)CMP kinase [Pseudomonadota bacterium]
MLDFPGALAHPPPMIIAIDGTLASGKGTLARRISARYGLPHMDTGRLYRATAVSALRRGTDFGDSDAMAEVARRLDLGSFDEADLRTPEAGQAASKAAAIPAVRSALLELQRTFASQPGGAVLDGRDIGTVICPDADVKLWIDADVRIRAERRLTEYLAAGQDWTFEQVVAQLDERDARDRNRLTAPMAQATDAVLIDTGPLTIDEAVERASAVIDEVRVRRET